jgi:hypothetical protein
MIHENIEKKLQYFYEQNEIPHILFYGSPGSGKKTIVNHFLNKIYKTKPIIKENVMYVNCSQCKGIKFIREELKFFAKTNIQLNQGIQFKTIVLLNADSLTTDAQSALRRCIELFSTNTRFFIIVENKNKLLNPILSRFCEIYVPDPIIEKGFTNEEIRKHEWIREKFVFDDKPPNYATFVHLANEFYENGISCLDFIESIRTTPNSCGLTDKSVNDLQLYFYKIKSEYRSEKLLLFSLFIRVGKPTVSPTTPSLCPS